MARRKITGEMMYQSSLLVFSLILVHVPVCAQETKLFSISYDKNNDNLTIKLFGDTVYDEKEVEEMNRDIQRMQLEIEEAKKRIAVKAALLRKKLAEAKKKLAENDK